MNVNAHCGIPNDRLRDWKQVVNDHELSHQTHGNQCLSSMAVSTLLTEMEALTGVQSVQGTLNTKWLDLYRLIATAFEEVDTKLPTSSPEKVWEYRSGQSWQYHHPQLTGHGTNLGCGP